jgi:uncharacterized protein (TIGR03067 family)
MRRILPLLAVLLMGFAPAPFPKPGRNTTADLAALRGEWELVSASSNGGPFSADGGWSSSVYDGNRLSSFRKGVATCKWIVTLYPLKEPKRMDLKEVDAPGQAVLCIYKLDGDTLTLAYHFGAHASERPTDFKPHESTFIEVLKQKKR